VKKPTFSIVFIVLFFLSGCDGKSQDIDIKVQVITDTPTFTPTASQTPTITQTPTPTPSKNITKDIKLLSQNAMYVISPMIDKPDVRLPCTFDLIKEYDIVALQEVFDEFTADELVRQWYMHINKTPNNIDFGEPLLFQKKTIPNNQKIKGNTKQTKIVHDDYFIFGPDIDFKPNVSPQAISSGGLLILSKYPIIKSSGLVFKDCAGIEAKRLDCLANKGIIYARIQIGNNFVHVFNTHLQSGYSSKTHQAQLPTIKAKSEEKRTIDELRILIVDKKRSSQLDEIKKFINKMKEDDNQGRPVFVLGDFNIDDNSDYIINKLKKGSQISFIDVASNFNKKDITWTGKNQTNTGNKPWGNRGNKLANEDGVGERIDYCFLFTKKDEKETQAFLKATSFDTVPSSAPKQPYCFEENRVYPILGKKISGNLKSAIETNFKEDGTYKINNKLKDSIHELKSLIGLEKVNENAEIIRSGSNYIFDNKGVGDEKYYIFRKWGKNIEGTNNDLYIHGYEKIINQCILQTNTFKCPDKSDYSTISDHLGLKVVFDFSFYQPPRPTPTPTFTPTSTPTPSQTPISTETPTPTRANTSTTTATDTPVVHALDTSCLEYGVDRYGSDFERISMETSDPALCMKYCLEVSGCMAFTYVKPGEQEPNAVCYLKNSIPDPSEYDACVSGIKDACLANNPNYP